MKKGPDKQTTSQHHEPNPDSVCDLQEIEDEDTSYEEDEYETRLRHIPDNFSDTSSNLKRQYTSLKDRALKSSDIIVYLKLSRDTRVEGVLDSGAQMSCISPACAHYIQTKSPSSIEIREHKKRRYGQFVEGHSDTYKRTARVYYNIANKRNYSDFAVIPRMATILILGLDFIKKHKIILDLLNEQITLHPETEGNPELTELSKLMRVSDEEYRELVDKNNNVQEAEILTNYNIPSHIEKDPSLRRNKFISTDHPYEIMPRSFEKIDFKCDQATNIDSALIYFDKTKAPPGILLGFPMVKIENGKGFTYVFNPTKRVLHLPRIRYFGSYEEIKREAIKAEIEDQERRIPQVQVNREPFKLQDLNLGPNLTDEQKDILLKTINEHRDSFAKTEEELEKLNYRAVVIDTGQNPPVWRPPYHYTPFEREELKRHADRMLALGIIEPSTSIYNSPVLLVKKPNGDYRFCLDLRGLNKTVIQNTYYLPRMNDLAMNLYGASWFITMDCLQGFLQRELDPESRHKTSFSIPSGGKFQYTRLPFGYINSPAEFQSMMDDILGNLRYSIALVYVDDILIYASSFEELVKRFIMVLRRCQKYNLKFKLEKCKFGFNELLYLGEVISKEGRKTNPKKCQDILQFERPKILKDVRSFLGITDFFRKYIKDYAKIAAPLNRMKRKECKIFKWGREEEQAFHTLKEALTKAPVLQFYNPLARIMIDCDASKYGLGGMILQSTDDKNWHVVEYTSRMLTEPETKLDTTCREALAVIHCLKKFRPYIFGRKFQVRTDHEALKQIANLKDPHGKLARWALELANHDMEIIHRPGVKMAHVDCLSRYPVRRLEVPLIRATRVELEKEENIIQVTAGGNSQVFAEKQQEDAKLKKIITNLRKSKDITQENDSIIGKNYAIIQGVLYKINKTITGNPWKLVVPTKLRADVLKLMHDDPSAGHGGFFKTYTLARKRYYWDKMIRDIARYVQQCPECQLENSRNAKSQGERVTYPPPNKVFHRIAIDYIGPFKRTVRGSLYALVLIDYTSRFLRVIPSRNAQAKDSVRILQRSMFQVFSYVREVVTDGGKHFTGDEFEDFLQENNIQHIVVPPYSPQSNGVVERSNRDIKTIMRKYCRKNKKDWDILCDQVAFNHNVHYHRAINTSPWKLAFTREPVLKADLVTPVLEDQTPEDPEQQYKRRNKEILMAIERTTRQQQARNIQANSGRSREPYREGEYVVVKTNGTGLQTRWSKPYLIISVPSKMELIIQDIDPEAKKKTRRVHVQHVKKWFPAEPWCQDYGYLNMNNNEKIDARASNQVQVGSRKQHNSRETSRPGQPRSPSSVSVTSRPSMQSLNETPSIVELPPRHCRSRGSQVPFDHHTNETIRVPEQQQNQQQPTTRPRHNYNTRLNERMNNLQYRTQVITRYLNGQPVTQVIPRFLGYLSARRNAEARFQGNTVTSQQQVEPFRFSRGHTTRVFTPSAAATYISRL